MEGFFGWSNSNPMGCTFSGQGEVELWMFRTTNNNDWKGISEFLNEDHVISNAFQIYISDGIDDFFDQKLAGNAKLNEPLMMFSRQIQPNETENMHFSNSMITMLLNDLEHPKQLSNKFGEVDVVDLKIIKHNILEKHKDAYEVDIVFRNRFNSYIKVDKKAIADEGIFKNPYIDTFKDSKDKTFKFNMDSKKQVLKNERYKLETLEGEYKSGSASVKPPHFKGLEPFEMAQFKIAYGDALKDLELEYKNIYDTSTQV